MFATIVTFHVSRVTLQDRRASSQQEMDRFKNDSEKELVNTNKRIIDGKMQHDTLTKEVGQHVFSKVVLNEQVSFYRRAYTFVRNYKQFHQVLSLNQCCIALVKLCVKGILEFVRLSLIQIHVIMCNVSMYSIFT